MLQQNAKESTSMSTVTYEQRIQALEAAVADLTLQQSSKQADRVCAAHGDLTLDIEHPLTPAVPPKQSRRLRARVVAVHEEPQGFGLSETEWTALNCRESDE
jgi:hypothetical protein